MKHLSQDDLVLQFYGEAGGEFERHLRECADCQGRFDSLKQMLEAIQPPETPTVPQDYAQVIWGGVRSRLVADAMRSHKRSWSWDWRRPWIPVTAAALLIIAAFLVGRHFPTASTPAPIQTASTAEQRERILLVALSDHLDRSQVLLMELRHAPSGNELAVHRENVEELIASNRLYRQAALRQGDESTAAVLDELERLLLDVAHSEASSSDLEAIRDRIDSESLLFKVRVVDSKVKREVRSDRREGATEGSDSNGPKI